MLMKKSAIFNETREYRYILTREWDSSLRKILYIMLNPSTASHEVEDRTSKQCLFFAKKFEYGSLEVVNLFSIIATDPKKLKHVLNPIGNDNDRYILEAAKRADTIVVAWGEKHFINKRNKNVLSILKSNGHELYCLDVAKSGHPRHPSRMKHNIDNLKIYS
jgi:hypothetical protein